MQEPSSMIMGQDYLTAKLPSVTITEALLTPDPIEEKSVIVPSLVTPPESRPSSPPTSEAPAAPPTLSAIDLIKASLTHITQPISQPGPIKIENHIGYTHVPLGLAGPLKVNGSHQKSEQPLFAPLATTEGALIASVSRGCKALSGGVMAMAVSESMTRAPVFEFPSIESAITFYTFIPTFFDDIKAVCEMTTRHGKLTSITPHLIGKQVHVIFQYTCGLASGQNMATIATHVACQGIIEKAKKFGLDVSDYFLEGNLSADKKLSVYNVMHSTRGVAVHAYATLTNESATTVLRNTTARIHKGICMSANAAIRGGMMGNNINVTNVLAAMFIACGQDPACVVESAFAQLSSDLDPVTQDLTLHMYFPGIVAGTVGGGTIYPSQAEALNLLGVQGQNTDEGVNHKWAFVETIAAFALALDLSTASAIGEDTFAQAHKALGRKES